MLVSRRYGVSRAAFVHLLPGQIVARAESSDAGAQCTFLALQPFDAPSPEPSSLRQRFTSADIEVFDSAALVRASCQVSPSSDTVTFFMVSQQRNRTPDVKPVQRGDRPNGSVPNPE